MPFLAEHLEAKKGVWCGRWDTARIGGRVAPPRGRLHYFRIATPSRLEDAAPAIRTGPDGSGPDLGARKNPEPFGPGSFPLVQLAPPRRCFFIIPHRLRFVKPACHCAGPPAAASAGPRDALPPPRGRAGGGGSCLRFAARLRLRLRAARLQACGPLPLANHGIMCHFMDNSRPFHGCGCNRLHGPVL